VPCGCDAKAVFAKGYPGRSVFSGHILDYNMIVPKSGILVEMKRTASPYVLRFTHTVSNVAQNRSTSSALL
jgi:hypothetical protein